MVGQLKHFRAGRPHHMSVQVINIILDGEC